MIQSLRSYGIRARRKWRGAIYAARGVLQDTVTVRTDQGLFTMFTKDRGIGVALYRERQYEYQSSIRAVKTLKNLGFVRDKNTTMFDIGANIGVISIGLVRAGEVQQAVACEPESRNFEVLRRNIHQNMLSERVLPLQVAVSDEESKLEMELSPTNPGDHRIRKVPTPDAAERLRESTRPSIQVPALPLWRLVQLPEVERFGVSSPSFAWIDIQGYEGYVFKGGGRVLGAGLRQSPRSVHIQSVAPE